MHSPILVLKFSRTSAESTSSVDACTTLQVLKSAHELLGLAGTSQLLGYRGRAHFNLPYEQVFSAA